MIDHAAAMNVNGERQGDQDLLVAAVIKLLNVEKVAIPVVKTIVSEGRP